jgi:hypothetical protein
VSAGCRWGVNCELWDSHYAGWHMPRCMDMWTHSQLDLKHVHRSSVQKFCSWLELVMSMALHEFRPSSRISVTLSAQAPCMQAACWRSPQTGMLITAAMVLCAGYRDGGGHSGPGTVGAAENAW